MTGKKALYEIQNWLQHHMQCKNINQNKLRKRHKKGVFGIKAAVHKNTTGANKTAAKNSIK